MIVPLPAPLRVSLEVTEACDLACPHCRQGTAGGLEGGLTFEDIRRVIDDAAEMGVFRLTFSGGEPMLREDIVALLLHAVRSQVGRVFLSTNGQHLDKHELEPLLPYRDRLTFKISLDGPPPLHDRLRGRVGAGAAARQAIAALVGQGLDVHVTTTLMRENLDCLEELLAWTAQTGCSRHYVVEVVPVGRATPAMVLTAEARHHAGQVLRRARDKSPCWRCAIVAKLPFAREGGLGFRCTGGTEECGILADGSVVGCRLMPDLVEGNIKQGSLREIWSAPKAFGRFRRISSERLLAPCSTCERNGVCLGGCHAFARGVSGSFYAPDPRCPRVAGPGFSPGTTPCWASS